MLTENLFDEILMRPVKDYGVNELRIVSGFASDSLARLHIERLKRQKSSVSVELIVGMTPLQGIEESFHNGFCKLSDDQDLEFSCKYLSDSSPDHSKIYCWLRKGVPKIGFVGSANYSITGFLTKQKETMVVCDAEAANKYYQSVLKRSINCSAKTTPDLININVSGKLEYPRIDVAMPNGPSVKIPLILKNGQTPSHSGINWGQRIGRNPNQAYLALPVKIRDSDFFPPLGVRFSAIADDGWEVEMSRAQQKGKALHTPTDNAALGRFLRGRLGLESGEFVTKEHLNMYGRSDIEFRKISENLYFLNFKSNQRYR